MASDKNGRRHAYQREIAEVFEYSSVAIGKALKSLGIIRKKRNCVISVKAVLTAEATRLVMDALNVENASKDNFIIN